MNKYLLKEESVLNPFNRNLNIFDEEGKEIYTIKNNIFSFRPTLSVLDLNGHELAKVKKHFFFNNYTLYVEGEERGSIKRNLSFSALFTPSFLLTLEGQEYLMKGNFFANEFQVLEGEQSVAQMTREHLTWGRTYSISIEGEKEQIPFLSAVITIDFYFQKKRRSRRRGVGRRGGIVRGIPTLR